MRLLVLPRLEDLSPSAGTYRDLLRLTVAARVGDPDSWLVEPVDAVGRRPRDLRVVTSEVYGSGVVVG